MLRGYRGILAALAGLAALFVALGTGAYFGSLYAPGHKQYQAVSGEQGGQQEYAGPSQSLPDIAGLPGPVERAIANPRPSHGEDNEKRDLAAQEASALWAFWMVAATFASVMITAVGTIFLYKQIVLTREAVGDTSKATLAMERQNELAARQQRPWLTIGLSEPFISRSADGILMCCMVDLGNIGATPAFDASVDYALAPAIRNPIHDFQIVADNVCDLTDDGSLQDKIIILPGGKGRSQIFLDLRPDDPRHPFDDGVVPTFMVWANYALPDGTRAHSSAWFTVAPRATAEGGPNVIFWDAERVGEGEAPLEIESYGYIRVT